MNTFTLPFILLERVLIPTLEVCLLLGGLASLLFGFGLVFRTPKALAFMRRMNQWVSTRRALKEFEVPREMGRGRSVWFALFLVGGAAFVLYYLVFRMHIPRTAAVLGVDMQRWFLFGVLLQTVRWLLIAGSVLALAVGVMQLFVPRKLVSFEERMNRWYSTRRILPAEGDTMRYPLDILVEAYPHAAGWLIAAASLLVALAMGFLLAAKILA
jgi:hypothetical protein